ncbi:UNVERIFIED_CONTAM: hypothetical protein GTU68_031832 [Idotea baltica]|nr:hypothetical protein [Idotea baltica]
MIRCQNFTSSTEDCSHLSKMVLKIITDEEEILKGKLLKKKFFCKNNKKKKQQPFSGSDVLKFSDYDCVGFDLDNTICRYKVGEIMRLEYKLIAEYMVHKYGYDQSLLLPLEDDFDFIQKGLILDIKRGNFLKCSKEGVILRATHGTQPMTRSQILETYGKEKIWEPVLKFSETLYDHTHSEYLRSFKDYFDLPAAVACARAIDVEDRAETGPPDEYDVWPDVHIALCSLYRRENYRADLGGFFPEMKERPEFYMYEVSDRLKKWLRSLHEHTFTFMISGSSVDYASHTAEFVLGPDWRDYFDMVAFTAKKPGFFTGSKPFLKLDGIDNGDPVPLSELRIDGTYANGNWKDLLSLVKQESGVENPHCLYVGDHLCQDALTPTLAGIDTVAVVEEMAAEGMIGDPLAHEDGSDLMSSFWGSFFTTDGNNKVMGTDRINTLYGSIPQTYTRMAIPFLDVVSRYPIKHSFPAFTKDSSGYYPGDPVILHF